MRAGDLVYVAGHRGLVGSALVRRLRGAGYDIITRSHEELDLEDGHAVRAFFQSTRPAHVFVAAAKVGGIQANAAFPADFLHRNLMIECHVIHAAFEAGVRKLLFLGSSCIYPRLAPQPIQEDALLTGPLEPTNEAYAIAKIAGIKLCSAYNRQYGTNYLAVMPTNLYGPGDRYDARYSHVIPALIRKFHEAKHAGRNDVTVWGTGEPRREFLHSDDLADACVFLMERHDARDLGEVINVGVGVDLTIRDLATLVQRVVGYTGRITFDASHPDGTPRKLLDVSRLTRLGWRARISLEDGLASTYRDYLENAAGAGAERGVATKARREP